MLWVIFNKILKVFWPFYSSQVGDIKQSSCWWPTVLINYTPSILLIDAQINRENVVKYMSLDIPDFNYHVKSTTETNFHFTAAPHHHVSSTSFIIKRLGSNQLITSSFIVVMWGHALLEHQYELDAPNSACFWYRSQSDPCSLTLTWPDAPSLIIPRLLCPTQISFSIRRGLCFTNCPFPDLYHSANSLCHLISSLQCTSVDCCLRVRLVFRGMEHESCILIVFTNSLKFDAVLGLIEASCQCFPKTIVVTL